MPEFDSRLRLFRVTLTGRVDVTQVLATLQAMLAHPSFFVGAPAIWIAHDADLSPLTRESLVQFREFQSANTATRGPARVALVSSNDLAFGIGRMFEQTVDLPHLQINVFRDEASALKWVLDAPRRS